MTEQERKDRQQRAYENRDSILPGDILKTKCTGVDRESQCFAIRVQSGDLFLSQWNANIQPGDIVALRCVQQTVMKNAYGLYVDYHFIVDAEGNGLGCCISGPDAQSLLRTVRPVKINNRDIPVLRDVLAVMQSVNRTEQLREWQRARMVKITASLTGMPGGGERKGLDDAVSLLDELGRDQIRECREYGQHLRRAQHVLNAIESRSMRAFVMMRYVIGVPDAEIRRELGMTRRGFDRAVRAVHDAPDMASVKWQERYILEEK